MRAHYAVAVVAVILVGVGVKLLVFSAPTAEADVPVVSMDISKMHENSKNLSTQQMHDMTFVFSDGD
jgi:hypothetical protein